MKSRPESWTIDELVAADLGVAALRCLPRFRALAGERLALRALEADADVPAEAETLIVLGGGTLIDEAKLWRLRERPQLRLIAIPSVWGSGAEASPVVALLRDGEKLIEMDDELVPHVRVVWPELAASLPPWRARDACGDTWAHALEGFLSPLASPELRDEIASLVRELGTLPLANDARWFGVSARASAAQARASVGLVHGIAHTLEGPLQAADLERPFGHARLCALFLWPVLTFDRQASSRFDEHARAHMVDADAVIACARELFDERAYEVALPALEERWDTVLRDRCTRTNGALVRPEHLSWFTEWRFA